MPILRRLAARRVRGRLGRFRGGGRLCDQLGEWFCGTPHRHLKGVGSAINQSGVSRLELRITPSKRLRSSDETIGTDNHVGTFCQRPRLLQYPQQH